MCEKRENCFYYLDLARAPRVRELINQGKIRVEGGFWCDLMTPISEKEIPPEGLNLSCVGPGNKGCLGFTRKH